MHAPSPVVTLVFPVVVPSLVAPPVPEPSLSPVVIGVVGSLLVGIVGSSVVVPADDVEEDELSSAPVTFSPPQAGSARQEAIEAMETREVRRGDSLKRVIGA